MSSLSAKKIIVLFGNLEMGGAERQGLHLAKYLKDNEGADLHVWGLGKGSGPVADHCRINGIPCSSVQLHWGLLRMPHLLRLCFRLAVARPEILISYTKVPNLAAALLWRFCGARLCVWNQADSGLLLEPYWFHRLAISMVQHFIANADGGRDFLIREYVLEPTAVTLIRNGISLAQPGADRSVWRERLEVCHETPVAVMVANLSSYKDHYTLLQAWKILLDAWDGKMLPLLVLAGRFDDMAEQLQKQAEQSGITDQLRFTGAVDDISGLLLASDLLVHSSRSEGIPNAVLEGMATGLPVAGTDIPGMREAVGDEASMFLAPVADPTALASVLKRLLSDPELMICQGKTMKRRISELFSLDRMCRETVEYLNRSLEMS